MKIYQITNSTPNQMMGYVLSMKNGKTVLIDGGQPRQSDELYRVLKLSGNEVDTMFMTHMHCDHYGAPIEMFTKYPDMKVGRIIRNRMDETLPFLGKGEAAEAETWMDFEKVCPFPIESCRIGDRYVFGDEAIEVLGVNNPEITEDPVNNQSMVLRVTAPTFSMLFLGDLTVLSGEKLLRNTAPEKLRADAVQMSHHGQEGVTEEVYRAIAPTFAFWPTPDWLWDNKPYLKSDGEKGTGPFLTLEVREWMEKIGTVNILSFEKTVCFDTETRSWWEV